MDFFSLLVIITFFAGILGLMWFLFVATSNGNKGVVDYFKNKQKAKFEAERKQTIFRRDNFTCQICKINNAVDIFPVSGFILNYNSPNEIIAVCNSCKEARINNYHKEQSKPLKEKVLERDRYICHYCGELATEVYNSVPFISRYLDDKETGYPDDFHVSMCEKCAIDKATPEQFKEFISRGFEKSGYDIFDIGKSGEQGFDFSCFSMSHEEAIVRCKTSTSKLEIVDIRDFHKTMVRENTEKGYFVTTGQFTEDATRWAKENEIVLIDRSRVHTLMSKGIYFINRKRQ